MKNFAVLAVLVSALGLAQESSGQTFTAAVAPRVGEIRAFAVAPGNAEAVLDLHRSGWIEARGQLVSIESYPELYRIVGRDWTAADVRETQFAVPEVRDERFQRAVATANAMRVLGPGDLITGGRKIKSASRLHPIYYWVFVGRAVQEGDGAANRNR